MTKVTSIYFLRWQGKKSIKMLKNAQLKLPYSLVRQTTLFAVQSKRYGDTET